MKKLTELVAAAKDRIGAVPGLTDAELAEELIDPPQPRAFKDWFINSGVALIAWIALYVKADQWLATREVHLSGSLDFLLMGGLQFLTSAIALFLADVASYFEIAPRRLRTAIGVAAVCSGINGIIWTQFLQTSEIGLPFLMLCLLGYIHVPLYWHGVRLEYRARRAYFRQTLWQWEEAYHCFRCGQTFLPNEPEKRPWLNPDRFLDSLG